MDFIVLGCGAGAVLLVASVVLRDVVPARLAGTGDETPWSELRLRRRRARMTAATGRVAAVAGGALLVVTALLVLLGAANGTGLAITLALVVLALLLVAGWTVLVRQSERTGAIARRQLLAARQRLRAAEQRRAQEAAAAAYHEATTRESYRGDGSPMDSARRVADETDQATRRRDARPPSQGGLGRGENIRYGGELMARDDVPSPRRQAIGRATGSPDEELARRGPMEPRRDLNPAERARRRSMPARPIDSRDDARRSDRVAASAPSGADAELPAWHTPSGRRSRAQ